MKNALAYNVITKGLLQKALRFELLIKKKRKFSEKKPFWVIKL
jgi:hypothetical protein